MSPRARVVVATVLTGLVAIATGCADLNRKGHEFDGDVSDSWIAAAKLKSEQSQYGQVSANHGHVRTADGVVAADVTSQNHGSRPTEFAETVPRESDLDMDQPMGHRSLPYFPVFAVRPW